jgi:hypothetical protein
MPEKTVIKVKLNTEVCRVWRDPVHASAAVGDQHCLRLTCLT